MRKYSINEIDRMRSAIERGFYAPGDSTKRAAIVEDRIRTHMVNGTEPEELERAAGQFAADWQRSYEAQQKMLSQATPGGPSST